MGSQAVFGLFVRMVGLLVLLFSGYQFFRGWHFYEHNDIVPKPIAVWKLSIGVLGGIAGAGLLFGAEFVVRAAYWGYYGF